MAGQVELAKSDKVDLFGYAEAANLLIKNSKEELNNLQHKILLAKTQLQTQEEALKRQKNSFEAWKSEETIKFNNEKNAKINSIKAKEVALERGEQDIKNRLIDAAKREENALSLDNDRKKLSQERLEVEKLRAIAAEQINVYSQKITELETKLSSVAAREKEANENLAKIKSLNSSTNVNLEKIEKEKKEIELGTKNLLQIKEDLEPKLKDIKIREGNLDFISKQLQEKEKELQEKEKQIAEITSRLQDKDTSLRAKEREILTLKEEVDRKLLILGAK